MTQATDKNQDLLIAPVWDLAKSSVQSYIDKELERRRVVQGAAF